MPLLLLLLAASQSQAEANPGASLVIEPAPGLSDQSPHVQAVLDSLPAQRQHYIELELRGDFTLLQPILLDNFTALNLRSARLVLKSKQKHSVLQNRAGIAGNHHIRILGGQITGNRNLIEGKGASCVNLLNSSQVHLEHLEVRECALDGVLVDGRGKKARNIYIRDLLVTRNLRDGLIVTWAIRDATVDTVNAHSNGRYGVYSDHSESDYSNIRASRNRLDGIFIRNVFQNSYRHLRTRNNGRHGIAVQGMVESTGSDWRSHNNGTWKSEKGAADIFFSANDELSYGINARLLLDGVIAGPSKRSTPGNALHAIRVEAPDADSQNYNAVQLSNVLLLGKASLPASSPGFRILSPLMPAAEKHE